VSRYELPALTITVTPAPMGAMCGVGRDHPATEHYEYSDRGGPIDRCEKHGGEKMRDVLRANGHEVIDKL